jgi:hypothetical protein
MERKGIPQALLFSFQEPVGPAQCTTESLINYNALNFPSQYDTETIYFDEKVSEP